MKNIQIDLLDTVYSPREDSYFMRDLMLDLLNDNAIEIGCGTGIIILSIAKKNPNLNFLAIDLNFEAAKLTLQNSILNKIPNLQVLTGDLLSCFRKGTLPKYILFNPPYLPKDPVLDDPLPFNDLIQFVGGPNGYELSSKLIEEIENDAILYIIISSVSIKIEDYSLLHTDKHITLTNSLRLKDGEILHLIQVRNKNG